MPSWIRNSMIVVFKTGRSPSRLRAGPWFGPAIPNSPVESYRHLIYWITIIEYNLKGRNSREGPLRPFYRDCELRAMTVSKTADAGALRPARSPRKENGEGAEDGAALQLGELSELLGYSLKRAQLKVFE